MLSQTFRSFVIEAGYLLNKNHIANNFCINKNKPALQCNGKCYLARQLKEQEKQERQAPGSKKEKLDTQPFFLPNTSAVTCCTLLLTNKYYHTGEHLTASDIPAVFHPPTA